MTESTKTSKKDTPKKESTKKSASKKENKLQAKILEAEASIAQEKDKFMRLFAEFENYKKRTSKERLELFKTANQEVVTAMLPVLDDFERAVQEIQKNSTAETLTGIQLIYNKFSEILKNQGLNVVEVEKGDTFDPEIHEAITQIPAPEENLKGKIIDIITSGYSLGERIIRYPKVVVGN